MSASFPTSEAVDTHVAAFERDLAAAPSLNDAKLLRDRYLGRKHSVVATWMQLIGSAPADQKKNIGQHANGLVQDDALPETGIEKHQSYMLQWYTFAALAAGLWLWFSVRPSWQRWTR